MNKVAFISQSKYKNPINKSIVQVSEMVGPCSTKFGRTTTQMTLNTFQFAGVSSKSNVTRGVPGLKELLHISRQLNHQQQIFS